MNPEDIKRLIEAHLPGAEVSIGGDGHHFEAVVVSEAFAGLNRVRKQQLVYAAVGDKIASGELHALSFKTFTPEEWKAQKA